MKRTMTHRERVQAALAHREPDRIPLDLGGRVTTIHQQSYARLMAHLGLPPGSPQIDPFLSVMNPAPALLERLGVDFQYLFLKGPEYLCASRIDETRYYNEWGVRVEVVGLHSQRVGHPLEHASLQDLKSHPWPDPMRPERTAGLREKALQLYRGTDFALAAAPVSGGIFEYGQHLRGLQNFFMDLVSDREFAEYLLDALLDVHLGLWDAFLAQVGDVVEMVQLADDFGSQKSLLISPRLFRDVFKPRYTRLIRFIKERTQAKVFFHCDGAILKLIPDLIEMGVEVLNPLQPTAEGMDPAAIKALYGRELCFHGAIDNQHLLPNGTPDEVRAAVRRVAAALAPGGGFILAAAHLIEPDIPDANLLAMVDETLRLVGDGSAAGE